MDDRETLFAPLQAFREAVGLTKKFLAERILSWRIRGNGAIEPRIDQQKLERDGRPSDEYWRILQREVCPILAATVSGSELGRLRWTFSPKVGPLTPAEAKGIDDELESRSKIIRETLAAPSLRARYMVKKTAKGQILSDFRWDLSVKRHDFRLGTLDPVPFATLELVLTPASRFQDSPLTYTPLLERESTLTFDCHLDDISELIEDLLQIRDNLKKLESKES